MAQQSLEEQKRQQQYEKRLLQQQKAQERQGERHRQRVNDKTYQRQQQEKQRLNQLKQAQKQRQRQQEKLQDPAYRQQRLDKAREAQLKNADKQLRQLTCNKTTSAAKVATRKPIKSKGLKGRNLNTEERRLAEKIASIGCICCLNQGWTTALDYQQAGQNFLSLHHIEGRIKPWAHAKVLPLCAYHHQTPPPKDAPESLFPIHGNAKTHWEQVNGTQEQLLQQVYQLIQETPPWICPEIESLAEA